MKRIIKNISPYYIKNKKYFVKRISKIVSGVSNWEPYRKDSGYNWQIDMGNDWWCTLHKDGTLELDYRYDGGGNVKFVDAIVNLIEVCCTNGESFL